MNHKIWFKLTNFARVWSESRSVKTHSVARSWGRRSVLFILVMDDLYVAWMVAWNIFPFMVFVLVVKIVLFWKYRKIKKKKKKKENAEEVIFDIEWSSEKYYWIFQVLRIFTMLLDKSKTCRVGVAMISESVEDMGSLWFLSYCSSPSKNRALKNSKLELQKIQKLICRCVFIVFIPLKNRDSKSSPQYINVNPSAITSLSWVCS